LGSTRKKNGLYQKEKGVGVRRGRGGENRIQSSHGQHEKDNGAAWVKKKEQARTNRVEGPAWDRETVAQTPEQKLYRRMGGSAAKRGGGGRTRRAERKTQKSTR